MDDKEKEKRIRKKLEEMNRDNNKKTPQGKNPVGISPIILVVMTILFGLYVYFGNFSSISQDKKEITYTEFMTKMSSGEITEVKEKDDKIMSIITVNKKKMEYSARKITDRIGNDANFMSIAKAKNIKINALEPSGSTLFWMVVLQFLPIVLLIGAFIFLSRKMGGGQGGAGNLFSFGKVKTDKVENKPNVKFEDVAGVDEAKEELKEVVEFLKNSEKFTKAGARIPKGVLLLGRPGTGKTLLAKAVAGESGASFFSIAGSEFEEMFVGVGASRVRDLFEKAKKNKPSIIFIDEIDSVGRRRSSRSGNEGGSDQTLNQLLVEMDGFEEEDNIIVVAATNREDVLDPALLRPGRFDRRVMVDAPDMTGRIQILKVHSKNKKFSEDVKMDEIAKITPGFVGADLENLLNEAAILAARESREIIEMKDLDEAVDKIGMGLGQKSKIIKPKEKRLLAYHEAGHALMSELTDGADPVHKVTIIPRGNAGGFMMPLPEEKIVTGSKDIIADIRVLFGGRAAEDIELDDISTGAYNDIKRATQLAKSYITQVGMSDIFGPVNLEQTDDTGYNLIPNISDETSREIDLEIRNILKKEYENTVNTLKKNKDKLDQIANLLLEKETITGYEVREIITPTIKEIEGEKEIIEYDEVGEIESNNFEIKEEIVLTEKLEEAIVEDKNEIKK